VTDGGTGTPDTPALLRELSIPTLKASHNGGPAPPGGPPDITAGLYTLCIKWEIQLTDHGVSVDTGDGMTITEDYWSGPDANKVVTARGVRVRVTKGGFDETFDAHPRTGCFSFGHSDGGPFDVRVYAFSTDENGNHTRVRDAMDKTFSFVEVVDPPISQNTNVQVGGYTARATLAAIAAYASYRANFGTSGKTIEVEESTTCGKEGGAESSAHYDFSELDDGIAHIRIHTPIDPDCSAGDHRKRKFLVTHEMGHAWMLLHTEQSEPDTPSDLEDAQEAVCGTGPGYSAESLEWSSIGAREGMGHFYGTEVFNSHESPTAIFTWFGKGFDVEYNSPNLTGGRLFNNCTTPERCGKATNIDWLRFWWDWHTPFEPGEHPNNATMRGVYDNAITVGSLNKTTYYEKFRASMAATVLVPLYREQWDSYADWNGIVTSPAGAHCAPLFGYPNCEFQNPLAGAGFPGCPCSDLLATNDVSDMNLDGFYPDGEGSYLEHGLSGLGQFCRDDMDSLPTKAVCAETESLGHAVPVCEVCEVDTMFACPCDRDADCQGLDTEPLVCWGSTENENGWAGSRPGRCMPSPDTLQGRDRLEEIPWICLDNCGSKAGGANFEPYVCVYDQLEPGLSFAHAQCVDWAFCSSPPGNCESQGLFCDPEVLTCPDPDDCCVSECFDQQHCIDLGYPNFYQCDFTGGTSGHCVPPGCANPKTLPDSYCSMFF
jgi:hypothetical protein